MAKGGLSTGVFEPGFSPLPLNQFVIVCGPRRCGCCGPYI